MYESIREERLNEQRKLRKLLRKDTFDICKVMFLKGKIAGFKKVERMLRPDNSDPYYEEEYDWGVKRKYSSEESNFNDFRPGDMKG
jgi:hypothetical protein